MGIVSPVMKSLSVGYHGLADLFAVLSPQTSRVYLVPVEEVGCTDVCLRLEPTLSGQSKGIRWVAAYILKSPVKLAI